MRLIVQTLWKPETRNAHRSGYGAAARASLIAIAGFFHQLQPLRSHFSRAGFALYSFPQRPVRRLLNVADRFYRA